MLWRLSVALYPRTGIVDVNSFEFRQVFVGYSYSGILAKDIFVIKYVDPIPLVLIPVWIRSSIPLNPQTDIVHPTLLDLATSLPLALLRVC